MKKLLFISLCLCWAVLMRAEMAPIFVETFDRCIDAEGENYGYIGGNDEQWGGDIATAIVIYEDSPTWSFDYCNGAYQCIKVGTSKKQGSATTPVIECNGEAILTCRVAPWEGDSIFTIGIKGGTTQDTTSFNLKKHQWTTVTVRIENIQGSLQLTFSSLYKHRFFLDDVIVRPADPNAGAIRTSEGNKLDWGLVGSSYEASKRVLHVHGANLTDAGISVSLDGSVAGSEPQLFQLGATSLPAEGGELAITVKPGASESMHGAYLLLSAKDKNNGQTIHKRVMLSFEVTFIDLEGAGTRPNPYTCKDVITLAQNDGTVWTETYYWATGFVIGGVKRYQEQYDGVSMTDKLSLILADQPGETNDSKYVLVQISHDAREALNVVDNPELIGVKVKVQGLLLNSNANPMYLGKPGVRNVSAKSQYWRPAKDNLDEEDPMNGTNDPDEPVDPVDPELTAVEAIDNGAVLFDPALPAYNLLGVQVDASYRGIVLQNGRKFIR